MGGLKEGEEKIKERGVEQREEDGVEAFFSPCVNAHVYCLTSLGRCSLSSTLLYRCTLLKGRSAKCVNR